MQVNVTARGPIADEDRERAQEKISELAGKVGEPLLSAHVTLREEANPRIERGARAEGEVDVNGRTVRAQVADISMPAAIDQLVDRLARQVHRHVDRMRSMRRDEADATPGRWRNGEFAPSRPGRFTRPVGERELVRRKGFAVAPMDPLQAVVELEDLDHDFFLFRGRSRDVDAIVYHRDDGHIGLIGPRDVEWDDVAELGVVCEPTRQSEPVTIEQATAEMDELNHRFLFFYDAADGRGKVIYLRYDGNYGLIEPGT